MEDIMLKRKMLATLKQWNEEDANRAFMLIGARQTGKTYIIREFAGECFAALAEVNLYEDENAKMALSAAQDADDFLARLSLVTQVDASAQKTLLFIDEIQEAPDIMTMVKFLVEEGRHKVVVSGSMLGTEFRGFRSFPVGYVEMHRMYPLDFEEFCWAQNVPQGIIDDVREAYASRHGLDDGLHNRLMQIYKYHIAVGGMPASVSAFVEGSNNITLAREINAGIVEDYRYDISKYAAKRSLLIQRLFNSIPSQLDKQNKRFRLDSIKDGASFDRYEDDFIWLIDAGVALPAYCVSEPKKPLARTAQKNKFKLYESDTGLLLSQYEPSVTTDVVVAESKTNFGSVYENSVAQEFACQIPELYYYYSSKNGEVDFLVTQNDGRVLPVEVKSGKDYKLHTSLNTLLGSAEYGIPEAVVLSLANVSQSCRQGKPLWYLPLYMSFCIAQNANGKMPETHLPAVDFADY